MVQQEPGQNTRLHCETKFDRELQTIGLVIEKSRATKFYRWKDKGVFLELRTFIGGKIKVYF
jgi:hypothetical protein